MLLLITKTILSLTKCCFWSPKPIFPSLNTSLAGWSPKQFFRLPNVSLVSRGQPLPLDEGGCRPRETNVLLATKAVLSLNECFSWSPNRFFRLRNVFIGHQNRSFAHQTFLQSPKQFFCSPNVPLVTERLV